MTVSQACLLLAALMPFAWTMCAKSGACYDNRAPRQYLAQLEGWRARAFAAHQNSWEALALFTGALVVAWHNGANVQRVDQLAIVFVASRVVYGVFYLLNWAALRSLVWTVGFACVVWLFFVGP